jgi:hypothetical protein
MPELHDVAENEYFTTRCAGGTKARRRKTKLCVSVPPVTEGNEWFEKSGTMREKGLDQSTPIGQSGSYIQSELVNPIHAAGHPTTLTNPKLTGWDARAPRSPERMNHFYPGMGATSSMFGELWRKEFDGQFHDWPEWRGETSITDIAKRIIEEHKIESGDTVIGTSLGGIVACEIANLIDLERVVLIGSAKSKEEINRILSTLHPLIDLAPIPFIQMSSGKLPNDLAEMFSHSDPAFIRNMSKAIFAWEGFDSEVPVLRIHGTKDLVIPNTKETNHEIDGGQLIAMTHRLECIEAIKAGSQRRNQA